MGARIDQSIHVDVRSKRSSGNQTRLRMILANHTDEVSFLPPSRYEINPAEKIGMRKSASRRSLPCQRAVLANGGNITCSFSASARHGGLELGHRRSALVERLASSRSCTSEENESKAQLSCSLFKSVLVVEDNVDRLTLPKRLIIGRLPAEANRAAISCANSNETKKLSELRSARLPS